MRSIALRLLRKPAPFYRASYAENKVDWVFDVAGPAWHWSIGSGRGTGCRERKLLQKMQEQ